MTLSRARAMLTTLAGKHWIKMKLPTTGSKLGHLQQAPPCLFYCHHLDHHLRSFHCPPCLPFWGGEGLCITPSLCREVSVLKPSCDPAPHTFMSSLPSNVIPQIGQPHLGTLPLNLFLSSSSWLIPSLTHDTNSFYLLSLWPVSIASHLIKTGHTQGRSLGCQVPCYTPRDRQVFV